MATLTSANKRAISGTVRIFCCRAIVLATILYNRGGAHNPGVPSYAQNLDENVWASVRLVFVRCAKSPPMARARSKACLQAWFVREGGGGGGGRNWSADVSTNGFTFGQFPPSATPRLLIGSICQMPGLTLE